MAMAELTQRYPDQQDKLRELCLEKGPQVVNALRRFEEILEANLPSQSGE